MKKMKEESKKVLENKTKEEVEEKVLSISLDLLFSLPHFFFFFGFCCISPCSERVREKDFYLNFFESV